MTFAILEMEAAGLNSALGELNCSKTDIRYKAKYKEDPSSKKVYLLAAFPQRLQNPWGSDVAKNLAAIWFIQSRGA